MPSLFTKHRYAGSVRSCVLAATALTLLVFSTIGAEERQRVSTFYIPIADWDQYGNPVATRDGQKTGGKTARPFEIWMDEPQMEFVLVLPGNFLMGIGPDSTWAKVYDAGVVHRVVLTRPKVNGRP